MTDGLPWNWETFPQYLDALDAGKRDIDVAAYLPHSPLRVYVMGQRGANREPATAEDLALMRKLAKEAIEVGALGFASSRLTIHKTESGSPIPSFDAAREEIEEIARGVVDGGGGLMQFVPDIPAGGYEPVLQTVFDVAEDVGLPVTFTLVVGNTGDPTWPDAITMIEKANAAGGDVTAQLFPRPIGLIIGLQLTANPFVLYPELPARSPHLPLAERVAEMRKPEVRARILADKPGHGHPILYVAQMWDWIFPLDDHPNYEPDPSDSIGARARAHGVNPMEEAYDRLLDDDGRAMLLVATSNLENKSLDTVGELLHRDDVVLGLGDGGAHYGMICDASYSTYFLTHWARDRKSGRFEVRGRAPTDFGAGPGCRAGRPWPDRRGLQGRPQRHRPCGAAAAQAGDHSRPARRRASARPDRRGLRRDDRHRRGDRRKRGAHRCAARQAHPRPPARARLISNADCAGYVRENQVLARITCTLDARRDSPPRVTCATTRSTITCGLVSISALTLTTDHPIASSSAIRSISHDR